MQLTGAAKTADNLITGMDSGLGRGAGLLERICQANPRLIMVEAAPGWGKTFLGRQLCEAAKSAVSVHFAVTRDAERAEEQVQRALSGRSWEALDLAVFDGLDDLARNGGRDWIRRYLAQLTAPAPTLVLMSRLPLDLSVSDFLAPHEVLLLGCDDLALTRPEVSHMIAGTPMPPELLARATERAAGWPIAALFFARLAREGRLAEALDEPSSPALDMLHRYMRDHVLAQLPQPEAAVFIACAALGECTTEEISAALGSDVRSTIEDVARKHDQLFLTDQRLHHVHETAAGSILALFDRDVRDMRIRAAEALLGQGQHVRAATFAAAARDYELAARALDAIGERHGEEPSAEYQAIAEALPLNLIFASRFIYFEFFCNRRTRARPYPLLDRVRAFCNQLARGTDPFVHYSARIALTALLRMTHHVREAESQAQTCDALSPTFPDAVDRLAFLYSEKAAIAAWRGQIDNAMQLWAQFDTLAFPAGEGYSDARFATDFAIALQRWDNDELTLLTLRNLELARTWNDPAAVAGALAAMVVANAMGAPSTLPLLLAQLQETIASFPSASEAAEFAERFTRPYEGGANYPTPVACLLSIHAALGQNDQNVARKLLQSSLNGFDLMGQRYWQIVARLVAARIVGFDARTLLRECVTLRGEMDLPEIHAQIAALAGGGDTDGPLCAFLHAIETSPLFRRNKQFRLRILDRKVWRDGTEVHIRHREFELLAHLALANGPVSAATLCAAMWPNADENAIPALRMSIHRLRKQLDTTDAVVSVPAGYQLGTDISVDILEAENAFAAFRRLPTLNDDDRTSLHALFQYLCTVSTATLERESWYDKIDGRIEELRRGAGLLLAKAYLRIGEALRALEVGEALLHYDPLDEEAVAASVQALTASGDKSAAVRLWHHYVKRLSRDYGAQPSISLAELSPS